MRNVCTLIFYTQYWYEIISEKIYGGIEAGGTKFVYAIGNGTAYTRTSGNEVL
jgi:hypothetical protein